MTDPRPAAWHHPEVILPGCRVRFFESRVEVVEPISDLSASTLECFQGRGEVFEELAGVVVHLMLGDDLVSLFRPEPFH